MTRWIVFCPACGGRSTTVYRCDNIVDESDGEPITCGNDLVDEPVAPFQYPSDFGERKDGLVQVRFRRICVKCSAERFLPLEYQSVGDVIRVGCEDCGAVTKHRPTDEDVRYRPDGDSLPKPNDAQPANRNPSVSTPA